MAITTVTRTSGDSTLGEKVFLDRVSFAGDGAYPTGGTLTLQSKLRELTRDQRTILAVVSLGCGGYVPEWNPAVDGLKVLYGDNNNASDGPLIEVPNATDLSAVTFNLLVISK